MTEGGIILAVEDNPGDVRLLRETIQENFEVVGTVAAGVERAAKGDVDVVLLDLNLPDCGGIETIRTFRAACPDPAIIVMTSLVDERLAMDALDAGAQDYLVKGRMESETLLRSVRYVRASRKAGSRTASQTLAKATAESPRVPLRRREPGRFDAFTVDFVACVSQPSVPEPKVAQLAKELAAVAAGPADVVDLCEAALQGTPVDAGALRAKARSLALQVIGSVVAQRHTSMGDA